MVVILILLWIVVDYFASNAKSTLVVETQTSGAVFQGWKANESVQPCTHASTTAVVWIEDSICHVLKTPDDSIAAATRESADHTSKGLPVRPHQLGLSTKSSAHGGGARSLPLPRFLSLRSPTEMAKSVVSRCHSSALSSGENTNSSVGVGGDWTPVGSTCWATRVEPSCKLPTKIVVPLAKANQFPREENARRLWYAVLPS
jgi:hypothetical protein